MIIITIILIINKLICSSFLVIVNIIIIIVFCVSFVFFPVLFCLFVFAILCFDISFAGRRLSFSENDITNLLVRLRCERKECGGELQAAGTRKEGVWWSLNLRCLKCGHLENQTNDSSDRIRLPTGQPTSTRTEEQLKQRRMRRRTKKGVDAKDGVKENINRNGRGVKVMNVQTVAAALLCGQGYSDYATANVLVGNAVVSSR
jgi:hypothetical protein